MNLKCMYVEAWLIKHISFAPDLLTNPCQRRNILLSQAQLEGARYKADTIANYEEIGCEQVKKRERKWG